jgi:trans-aconitate methyltransferase
MSQTKKEIKATYDKVAVSYNQDHTSLKVGNLFPEFTTLLPDHSTVLDLGCGDGKNSAKPLTKLGHSVIGLDFSTTQIRLAKQNCPTATFLERDIATLKPKEFSVDGIICLYALFHLPRIEHGSWLKTVASFLQPGAPLLITLGDKDFEGWHAFYGKRVWSSHYGPEKNLQLLTTAGFEIIQDVMDYSGGEKHQVVLAKKI